MNYYSSCIKRLNFPAGWVGRGGGSRFEQFCAFGICMTSNLVKGLLYSYSLKSFKCAAFKYIETDYN